MKKTLGILIGCSLLMSPSIWGQGTTATALPNDETFVQRLEQFDATDVIKQLRLNDVIEQGLRQNPEQEIRRYQDSILEIDWKDTHQAFWLPNLKLELQTTPQRLGSLKRADNARTSDLPTGSLALRIEDYTVFNWGKDHLLYLNAQSSYRRQKARLSEERRELRQQLIIQYFDLLQFKERERLAGDQLRHASFIYRINREKVAVNRVTRQEYYQARSEYLRAQTEFHQAKLDAQVSEEQMAYFIQDPPGTRYILNDEINSTPIKMTLQEAQKLAQENNPQVLTSEQQLGNAQRLHDLTLRENLPLPRISVDLGAWRTSFGPSLNTTRYGRGVVTDPTINAAGNQIELVASVNASWSIVGPGGLLNLRKTTRSQLSQNLAYRQLDQASAQMQSNLRELYKRVQHWQNQIKILEARTPTLQRNFDAIMENYMDGKTSFVDYKLALEELTQAAQLLEFTKFAHARDKILLAQEIGIEDFPGENFENLAIPKTRRAQ
jgi:outer membrane protein TolC